MMENSMEHNDIVMIPVAEHEDSSVEMRLSMMVHQQQSY